MIPFNLEDYIKNPLIKIKTRGGIPVEIKNIRKESDFPVLASFTDSSGDRHFINYTSTGRRCKTLGSMDDLFFDSEKHEKWINLYNESHPYAGDTLFDTKVEAIRVGETYTDYFKTIKIEWEDQL